MALLLKIKIKNKKFPRQEKTSLAMKGLHTRQATGISAALKDSVTPLAPLFLEGKRHERLAVESSTNIKCRGTTPRQRQRGHTGSLCQWVEPLTVGVKWLSKLSHHHGCGSAWLGYTCSRAARLSCWPLTGCVRYFIIFVKSPSARHSVSECLMASFTSYVHKWRK